MIKRRQRRSRRPGFTLLEVLLVLAILVILGSTATVYFARTQSKSYVKMARVQMYTVGDMLEQYRMDVGSYPTSQQGLQALLAPPAELNQPERWAGPYTKKEIPPDPWGNPYQYQLVSADEFRVWSFGPDGQNGSDDDVSDM